MAYKDKEKQRAYCKAWHKKQYTENPEYKKRCRERSKAQKKLLTERFQKYKSTLSCECCDEDSSCCLDFHHLDPTKKDSGVGNCIRDSWSWERTMTEIEKCVVVCANCHRKIHAGEIVAPSCSKDNGEFGSKPD